MSRPARDRAAQQPPPTSLAGFPSLVRPRRRLWRAGRSVQANPWWFDGSGAGRFDPIGTGQASCYLGTDRLAGLLEVLGPEMSGGAVHVDDLTARSVYPLDPAQLPTPIANLAHRRATGYGVTNELSTMTPYRCPQQWATALLEAGFWGLRYRTRFDPGPSARGLAVFGPAGLNPWTWPVPQTPTPAVTLRRQLELNCGITIIDTPPPSALPAAPAP